MIVATSLVLGALAVSTQAAYKAGQDSFITFLRARATPLDQAFPVSPDLLIAFTSWLFIQTSMINYDKAKRFLCHTKALCTWLGQSTLAFSDPRLEYALRTYRKRRPSRKRAPRVPITVWLLSAFLGLLDLTMQEDIMLAAALAVGVYGLFRSGELTVKPDTNPDDVLKRADVMWDHDDKSVTITLRVSKTDPLRDGVTIQLHYNGSATCPYTLLLRAWKAAPDQRPTAPLFQRDDGSPLRYQHLNAAIKSLASECGINVASVGGHSLRIGGATTLAAIGVPDHVIQQLGRWRSLSVQRYIRLTSSFRAEIFNKMGAAAKGQRGYFGGLSNAKAFNLTMDDIGSLFSAKVA